MAGTPHTVLRQGIAGAAGGLIAFILLEPGSLARDTEQLRHMLGGAEILKDLREMGFFGAVIGASIAGALTLGDELGRGRAARIGGRAVLALAVGAVIGGAAGVAAQVLFQSLLVGGVLPVARTLGWALLGAGMGVAAGAVTGSPRRAAQGFLGGAIGGAVGGILFDAVGAVTGAGTASRLIGLVATGVCVGIAVALVQELAKRAWIIVLTGRGEGTRYILDKPQLTIGRAELADVPLFGDPSLDRNQAVIASGEGGYTVRNVGRAPLLRIDGQPAAAATLQDGNTLELGRHRLRFHLRGAAPAWSPTKPSPLSTTGAPVWREVPRAAGGPLPPGAGDAKFEAPNAGSRARPAICLHAIEGPCASATFLVPEGGGRLGRAPENEICLAADGLVSRRHAEIFPESEGWVIRDADSSNGTSVNGERIEEAWINPGDEIRIGAGAYRLEEC